jgi:hypothetical protein
MGAMSQQGTQNPSQGKGPSLGSSYSSVGSNNLPPSNNPNQSKGPQTTQQPQQQADYQNSPYNMDGNSPLTGQLGQFYPGMYPHSQPQFGSNPYAPQTASVSGHPGYNPSAAMNVNPRNMASGGTVNMATGGTSTNTPAMWQGTMPGSNNPTTQPKQNYNIPQGYMPIGNTGTYSYYGKGVYQPEISPGYIPDPSGITNSQTSIYGNTQRGSTIMAPSMSAADQAQYIQKYGNPFDQFSQAKGPNGKGPSKTPTPTPTTTPTPVTSSNGPVYTPTYNNYAQSNSSSYVPAQTNYQAVDALGYPLFNRGGLASIPTK